MQTVDDFELIVVDDGSTDETRLVVESFDDERVKYVYQENSGIAAARNAIADISRGTFTAVHDDDDIMLPWRLEVSLSGIKAGVQASYGSWVNFDDVTGEMALHVIREQFCMPVSLAIGQTPGHATWLVETRLVRQFRYNETISSAVDHNLALRMMRSGVSWVHTGKVLFLRRMHPTQVSNSDGTQQKYAAELSRFMLQFAGSPDDIAALREDSKSILWPKIAEKGKLEESFGKYLPDHLAVRSLHVQGNVANKASRLQKLKSTSYILCEQDETGKIVGEYADFLNVTLEDLAAMRRLGVDGRLEGSFVPRRSPTGSACGHPGPGHSRPTSGADCNHGQVRPESRRQSVWTNSDVGRTAAESGGFRRPQKADRTIHRPGLPFCLHCVCLRRRAKGA